MNLRSFGVLGLDSVSTHSGLDLGLGGLDYKTHTVYKIFFIPLSFKHQSNNNYELLL